MECNIQEPDNFGACGLGCFVENVYVPADDCKGEQVFQLLNYKWHILLYYA